MTITTSYIPCSPITTPTLSPDTTAIPIADVSLWAVGAVQSVLCFEGALDEERLRKAVGLLSGVWPTLAGRYERVKKGDDYEFSLRLTSSPIPFETQTIESDQAFPDKHVVQPTLSPFLPPLGKNYQLPNTDAHLFSVRLTTLLPSGKSVLGIETSHVFIDGETKRKLLKMLDAFYVHGEAARENMVELAGYDLPTFFPHVGPLPAYDPSWNLGVGRTNKGHDLSECVKQYTAAITQSVQTVVELHRSEIKLLRDQYQQEAGLKLSEQDALSAWWIYLIKKVGVEDVNTVIYICNYRSFSPGHPSFPPNLSTLASNVAQMRHIPIPPTSSPSSSPALVAKAIREGVVKLRDSSDETLRWIATAAYELRKAAIEEKGQIVLPRPGEVSVNSNMRMDWNVSYGFPAHEVAFHTVFSIPRFLRVFQANPREGEEKGERLELIFNVADEGVKRKVQEAVDEERRAWSQSGAR
ncbi:hypothetical protein I350_06699 [Cryptococcus amylolentus CBS 6273]|uniref:Uncharacterized protein n=1 Tax=Cryptococcus amylolentus CBS 6273 TaxID=1296118 RepID=A0A1E3JGQ2_9TREE|nr:hypothetical protein I350_06699 [Cryptococcus amylolentus CBS 6273]